MITWVGLAVSVLLVVVAAGLSAALGLRIERDIVVAALRMAVQLAVVGGLLTLVVSPHRTIWWSWLWVVLMVGYAADVTARRSPAVPGLRWVSLAAFGAASVVTLGVIFGLRVFPVNGRTVVPIAGMMVGNSMTATVLAGRRVVEEIADKREQVEARLALGHDTAAVCRPYVRAALRSALLPQIEKTKAIGIVFLPGAMTGLILAGVSPAEAVRVQAVVMFLVLAAAATTTVVVAVGVARRLFTADLRLADTVPRPAQ
ncbi:ABC transporter permease [Leekyejoonella antrihumi]|uniref:Iron export ABC transporter permease subunit FetB n=1 Tax=Leekyejoonella antrihumi TaxID=1660198 RepID=A0A563E1V4_9MICO|nr:iron export ABC transporter permease subunit FetB [Leekyejoonella antrihumi]TWP36385.1 iron export ABC transporter permease subunit FetB [Leekyejoonella antrihumi]